MASVNKVILVGNLGRDPEQRFAPSGDAICNVTIATTESWKDKQSGEKKEATEWHKVVFFGRLAEIANQYLKKGAQIYVEGRLQTRKWQDKDGQDRYTTEIRGDEMKMLGSKPDGAGQQQAPRQSAPPQQAQRQQQTPAQSSGGGFGDFPDDIPFDRLGRGLSIHAL